MTDKKKDNRTFSDLDNGGAPAEHRDIRLWEEFQRGNTDAFRDIYVEHIDGLFSYGITLVRDPEFVRDIIQELFRESWDRRKNLGQVRNIRSYFYSALRFKLLRAAVRERKLLYMVDEDLQQLESDELVTHDSRFEDEQQDDQLRSHIRTALARLSPAQRQIIHLRFYEGLPVREIVTITGVKKKTVYYHLNRAIDLLKVLKKELFMFTLFRRCLGRMRVC
ncbi:RNA polymerase sigma factor [Sinomicrobium soli]|uniref:RNA polymerase sigma factor n=1 Tax=Sinomicrobium sp. N-1-3-6 TaxID=2219864 RepID=UPI00137527DF|nr:sigma-70 family RNA polymerase sigma factor [Sinomicrobium sp. N-1-3-6]